MRSIIALNHNSCAFQKVACCRLEKNPWGVDVRLSAVFQDRCLYDYGQWVI